MSIRNPAPLISLGDVLHSVHGNFHVQSATVQFDRNAPAISGSVVVAAGSGNTGHDTRDHKMLTEILDAPHFADISFARMNYQGTIAPSGDSMIQVSGHTKVRFRGTVCSLDVTSRT